MKLQKISMYGFKNHNDLVEYDLGDHTKVYGENGKGKTTIGEAVTWALLGTDLTGNERATTRLTNHTCKDVYVELGFTFKGEEHTLTRRKRGATNIFLDTNKVEQHELTSLYHSKELFLSIFNPSYFPALAPKDAKELLTKTLGSISKEEVYKELGDSVSSKLKETGFNIPNLYLENHRGRLREIEQELQYWNGFKDANQEEIIVVEERTFDSTELDELLEEFAKFNTVRVTPLHDMTKLMGQREELKSKAWALDAEIKAIESAEPQTEDVESLELELNRLRKQYKDQQELIINLDNKINCPNCQVEIDLDASRKQSLGNELQNLKVEGQKQAEKLSKAIENNKIIIKNHTDKAAKQIEDKTKEMQGIKKKIDNLNLAKIEVENHEHMEKQQGKTDKKLKELRSKIDKLQDEKQDVRSHNESRRIHLEQQEGAAKKAQEAKNNIEQLQHEKLETEQLISYAKQYNSKRLQLQAEQIDKHLDKVTIQLEKIVKSTGEIKDDFKILYNGKEFPVLSNSERIKAGLEIANLLINISGLNIPVFVDNAESITEIPKLNTQMIEARVKENADLTVEVA